MSSVGESWEFHLRETYCIYLSQGKYMRFRFEMEKRENHTRGDRDDL